MGLDVWKVPWKRCWNDGESSRLAETAVVWAPPQVLEGGLQQSSLRPQQNHRCGAASAGHRDCHGQQFRRVVGRRSADALQVDCQELLRKERVRQGDQSRSNLGRKPYSGSTLFLGHRGGDDLERDESYYRLEVDDRGVVESHGSKLLVTDRRGHGRFVRLLSRRWSRSSSYLVLVGSLGLIVVNSGGANNPRYFLLCVTG